MYKHEIKFVSSNPGGGQISALRQSHYKF